jgi:hypothetical protein
MKLDVLNKLLKESTTEDETPNKAPAPKSEEITGAQAAKILGCSMSRVRQYKADGDLKASREPEPGSRDSWYHLTSVQALKAKQGKDGELPRTGRPEGSKNGDGKKED